MVVGAEGEYIARVGVCDGIAFNDAAKHEFSVVQVS